MSELRDIVVNLLKSYPARKARLEQLRYELNRPASISEQEIIRGLSLGSPNYGGGTQSGFISDKTMAIALEYRNISRRMKTEAVNEIMREMRAVEADIERLEQYVSLLDIQKANIIRQYYFSKKSWDELEEQLHINRRTLQRHRNTAVNELVSMYSYITGFEKKTV